MVVKPDARDEPIPFGFTQSSRLIFVLLGATILLGALVAPWWTRGMDIDEEQLYETDEDGETDADLYSLLLLGIGPGSEGRYYNYGAFSTPTSNGMSTDSAREPAVAILGIGLVLCAVFAVAGLVVRWMMARGTLEVSYDAPVRLAIGAFLAGTFAVLWGAFFLPLAGDNPGMLYGEEPSEDAYQVTEGVWETVRYANVGFFLGIAGAVLFPAYLWFDAARVRALNAFGWGTDEPTATTA
jgi:hypothetical protein